MLNNNVDDIGIRLAIERISINGEWFTWVGASADFFCVS